ncbi:hypothetical protein PMAYCL1PPCAC_15183, partial [Pristionchus mayeri]
EILCLYLAIYNITYVMIDYSFLYRMWAIKSFLSCYYFWVPMESGRLRLRESTMRDFGEDTIDHVLIMGDYYKTIIPLVCLYSPCGLMIILPLLRIDAYWMARATPLLICSFLPTDTLAVILSMSDYRKEVARLVR